MAQPEDFGGSILGLGHGLMQAGGGLEKLSSAQFAVDERRTQRDENRWLGESYEQEKAVLNEWMAKPENHGKETFASDFSKFAKDRIAQYDAVAPSADARDAFRNNIGTFIGRKYEEALQTSEKTKLQNTVLSFDDQITNALMGYRQAQGVPGANAATDLTDSFGQIRLGIHHQFYEDSPLVADKLQSKLTTDLVLGVADDDPALAKKFLSMSPDLDEHTRQLLIKHIDQQERVGDLVAKDSFDRYRQNWLTAVENGKEQGKIPLDLYHSFYPRGHSDVQKAHDDALIDTFIKSRATLDRLSPMEANHQLNELSKLQSGIQTKEDADVFKHVAQQVLHNVNLQEKNRVSWLIQNNPEVKSLSQRAADAPESQRIQAITERNDAILKYQGYAPVINPNQFNTQLTAEQETAFQAWKAQYAPKDSGEDYDLRGAFLAGLKPDANSHWPDTFKKPNHPTFSDESKYAKDYPQMAGHWNGEKFVPPPDTSGWYLNKPTNDRHLMTLDEAEESATSINRANPAEAIMSINKVLSKYPDQKHQYVAFADMVTVPSEGKRLKQEYQLAFQNKDAWWIDSYIGAVANAKDVAHLTEEKRKDLIDVIDKQPAWQNFQRSMIGDNFSRSKEIEGFKSGITMYAESLVAGGRPLKKAVEASVNMLIGESLGFTSINNQPLAILKERADKSLPHRTDDEITDLGRRLSMSLRDIDPREVDQRNFPVVQKIPEGVKRYQALRDLITAKGFFQTSNDGQSALLYMQDDNGNIFQVTDKNRSPLTIHFDDVPGFHSPNVLGPTYDVPVHPSKTYDLESTTGNFLGLGNVFGTKHSRTNWPSMPTYIRRMQGIQPPPPQPLP